MQLFERRGYWFCAHCGTFAFIAGPDDRGVRTIEAAGAGACPRCRGSLSSALLDGRRGVHHCPQCRGLLLPRSAFVEAVERRRAEASGPPAPPVPLDPRELAESVPCPSCAQTMDVHPYLGPGNVVIDSCVRCDLIWLDRRELNQITDAPGRDRGTWRVDAEP